jgi:hypothetical protein
MSKIIKIKIQESYHQGNTTKSYDWVNGHWWGYNDQFLDEEKSNTIKEVLEYIKTHKPKINKKEIVYASKASEIPRFKLKEYISENKYKKTSRFNYASVIIINKGYLGQLEKRIKNIKEHVFIKGNYLKDNYKKWFGGKNISTKTQNEIFKIIKDSNYADNICMFIDVYGDEDLNKLFNKYPSLQKEYNLYTHKLKGTWIELYRDARLENLLSLLIDQSERILNGQTKIIFDEDMFVDLNKDGIILDDDYLQILRDMLFSKDDSNVKLGFEMMSNLKLDQPTLLSIAFLLNELHNTTKFRPSYYSSSNSNLKSLLKLLNSKNIYWDRDWKTFGTGLRMNFKDGKEGGIVKQFLLDNINREFKLSNTMAESLVDIVFTTETELVNL